MLRYSQVNILRTAPPSLGWELFLMCVFGLIPLNPNMLPVWSLILNSPFFACIVQKNTWENQRGQCLRLICLSYLLWRPMQIHRLLIKDVKLPLTIQVGPYGLSVLMHPLCIHASASHPVDQKNMFSISLRTFNGRGLFFYISWSMGAIPEAFHAKLMLSTR